MWAGRAGRRPGGGYETAADGRAGEVSRSRLRQIFRERRCEDVPTALMSTDEPNLNFKCQLRVLLPEDKHCAASSCCFAIAGDITLSQSSAVPRVAAAHRALLPPWLTTVTASASLGTSSLSGGKMEHHDSRSRRSSSPGWGTNDFGLANDWRHNSPHRCDEEQL